MHPRARNTCIRAWLVAARALHDSPRMKDITTKLDKVHGGAGAGRAIIAGAKTAARKGGEWLGNLGNWAGGAAAAKEGWDWLRGNNSGGGGGNSGGGGAQPSPAAPPTSD
jgi:hypothetical protein